MMGILVFLTRFFVIYLRIPVGYMFALRPEGGDDVTEGGEGAVDFLRLLEPLAGRARLLHSLRPGQIHQVQTALHFHVRALIMSFDEHNKH